MDLVHGLSPSPIPAFFPTKSVIRLDLWNTKVTMSHVALMVTFSVVGPGLSFQNGEFYVKVLWN